MPQLHSLPGHPTPLPLTSEAVIERLERAGRTLLALPSTGPSTRLVQSGLEWIRDASEACARPAAKLRPPIPAPGEITAMDEALAWIPLIPIEKYVLRRIVGSRSLVNPLTDRHMFTWRRIGTAMGSDHKAVQRWHAQGIDLIVAALRRSSRSDPKRHAGLPKPAAHHAGAHG